MRRAHLILFILLLSVGMALAVPITDDTFSITDYLSEGVKEIVYEVTPGPDMILSVALTGSNGYAPELRIFKDDALVPMTTVTAARGKTATHRFLSRGETSAPVTYRLVIVVGSGLPGAEYTFSYTAIQQDDAGSGGDAPESFDGALLLQFGTYTGFLGGDDSMDFYSLDVLNGEKVTFTLTAHEKGTLGIELTDATMFKRVETRRFLDPSIGDNVLTSPFLSLRDQNVKININGNVPYTLLIETDQPVPETPVVEPLPPLPPPPPAVVVTDDEVTDEEEDTSFLLPLIIGLAIIGVMSILLWHARKKDSAPKKKKK